MKRALTNFRDEARIFLIILSVVISYICPTPVQAKEMAIISEGVGTIVDDNRAKARDIAIQDALAKAVEQAMGTFLQAETMVENAILIRDSIYSKTKGYIKSYRVTEESFSNSLYRVHIEAYVATDKLEDDLSAIGLLMQRKHKPRVMVVINETQLGKSKISNPASETEMINRFLKKDFKVVDQDQVDKIRNSRQLQAALEGNDALAAKIGRDYGAEVIIAGKAFSEYSGDFYGFVSCRASVNARAILTDTGDVIAADGKQAGGADIAKNVAGEKALSGAGGTLADSLMEQILDRWSKEAWGATSVRIIIYGMDYQQLSEFKDILVVKVRGIEDVHQRTFTPERAVLDIDFKGDPQNLTGKISKINFDTFQLEPIEVTANRIDLRVVK